jgi:hypothetical protein
MYGSGPKPTAKKNKTTAIQSLLRELSDDEDEDSPTIPSSSDDSEKPYWREFRGYLDAIHEVPEGMTSIKWWGVSPSCIFDVDEHILIGEQLNQECHPVWASLARDYLSIMASSVSSERAFSQGGITITKRRNRLKGDIVEALQCVKCAIRHDLIFREPAPSSILEAEFDSSDESDGEHEWEDVEEEPWDVMLVDDEDVDLADAESD